MRLQPVWAAIKTRSRVFLFTGVFCRHNRRRNRIDQAAVKAARTAFQSHVIP